MLWHLVEQHPEAPPFTGGVLDSWPNWAAQGLAIARQEVKEIRSFLDQKRRTENPIA